MSEPDIRGRLARLVETGTYVVPTSELREAVAEIDRLRELSRMLFNSLQQVPIIPENGGWWDGFGGLVGRIVGIDGGGSRDKRQKTVADWVRRAFGSETMARPDERAARVAEEALELAQAMGVTRETAARISGYVYDRPPGNPFQEAGGVAITLLACCEAAGFFADDAERVELCRVLTKPIEHFRERQAAKRAAGITPGIRSDDRSLPMSPASSQHPP